MRPYAPPCGCEAGGYYPPRDPWVGQRWHDLVMDRCKVWTGDAWDRVGVRDPGDRTVIEHPFYSGDSR